ncbi:hypothetical protein NECAME_15070 [Necator americanus]|uniref:Peptidase S1 domain-containing protein n=1 Tax=Necator americanus TaxID=51031 RepID=W2SM91_NECAM|nr:hypothetical protein NECAME_15070 [Necator americanus]ETN69827.1 hypothetical protein NECAME_15070 [Necator americanus]
MNKKIDISDSSLRMSSFGWGSDRVKMTEKECKKFYPKKLDDTFCTFEHLDRNGDSGGGITANIGGRTYLAGVVSGGNQCDDLLSGSEKPEAQDDPKNNISSSRQEENLLRLSFSVDSAADAYTIVNHFLTGEERKDVGNDVKKIVKRDIDKDYSVDYNPTAGDETEEDEDDPMRTKVK